MRGLWRGEEDKPGTECHTWAIEQCRVPEAWRLVEECGKQPGEGVLIGHPDSGFVEHNEMDLGRVRIDIDKDFLEKDDETRTGSVKHGLHGLATASVIMSGRGDAQDGISGPACYAELLPLRVTKPGLMRRTPVLLWCGMRRLRNAVYYAVESGCKVISMSLGGVANRSLKKAICKANASGVIVCAAAGNRVRLVVAPAKYDETIAVAGSDINRAPWHGSCRGSAVDVTAPAESVWRATMDQDGEQTVCRSYGTSYAVALIAGIAAMWLSYRCEELAIREPGEIPELFRYLLKKTASNQHNLPEEGFGAGIVDAAALLQEPIPERSSVRLHSRPAEPADNTVLANAPDLGDIPEALMRELICAKSIAAMIDASEPVAARGLKPTSRRASNGAGQLSDQLTRWLAKHGYRADS